MTNGTKPLISVVMPAYNSGAYIKGAMESVFSQSYRFFEFIVINDGSTDATEHIIQSFADKRLVYIKNETNLGLVKSLNKGIAAAKGQFIARMDADDVCLPTRLEEQIALFETRPEAIVVGSDYYLMNGDKLTISKNINDSDYSKTLLLFTPCFCHPTVMMKNTPEINYEEEFVHAEDFRLWTQLASSGAFYNVNKPLLKYRTHNAQVSFNNRQTQLQISARIRKDYLNKLGFTYTNAQFSIHNLIGNNQFITSVEELNNIRLWLEELVNQNERIKKIESQSFKKAIHKFWIDSCGYSNLGLNAYRLYFTSSLAVSVPVNLSVKLKLFAKCVLRRFRSKAIS